MRQSQRTRTPHFSWIVFYFSNALSKVEVWLFIQHEVQAERLWVFSISFLARQPKGCLEGWHCLSEFWCICLSAFRSSAPTLVLSFPPLSEIGNVNGFYLMFFRLSHSPIWNPFVNVICVFGWVNSVSLSKHCCSLHCWWCWWWWWIAWMGIHLHGPALRFTVLKFLSL